MTKHYTIPPELVGPVFFRKTRPTIYAYAFGVMEETIAAPLTLLRQQIGDAREHRVMCLYEHRRWLDASEEERLTMYRKYRARKGCTTDPLRDQYADACTHTLMDLHDHMPPPNLPLAREWWCDLYDVTRGCMSWDGHPKPPTEEDPDISFEEWEEAYEQELQTKFEEADRQVNELIVKREALLDLKDEILDHLRTLERTPNR